MDPRANGQLQHHWGWWIAIYLFLGGMGAGAYFIAALNSFLGKQMEPSTLVGLWVGFPALAIGSICLLADLGSPMHAVRAILKVKTSWIARGTWIISIFMVLSLLHLILFLKGWRIGGGVGPLDVIAILGMLTAVGTMAYTGLLLDASKGIPFWRSGLIPVLFVVSALVTGHCFILLGMALLFPGDPATLAALPTMGIEAAILVGLEMLVVLLFLYSARQISDARESTSRILSNPAFIVGYILLGLVVPFALMLYLGMAGAGTGAPIAVAAVGSLLGLAGGLILRWAVLRVGAMPTWHIAGMEFRRVPPRKEPKPGIGLMPPS